MVNSVRTWWLAEDGSLHDHINWPQPRTDLLRTATVAHGSVPGSLMAEIGKLDRWGNPLIVDVVRNLYQVDDWPDPYSWDVAFNPPYTENGRDSLGRFLAGVGGVQAEYWTAGETFTVTMRVEFRDGSVIRSNTLKATMV